MADAYRTCTIDGCESRHRSLGLCEKHYRASRRNTQPRPTVRERIVRRSVKTEAGCWEWTGYRNPDGYGVILANRSARHVHRVMFEVEHGPIEEGLVIDHMCHNRACANPDHLRAVTQVVNVQNRAGATVRSTTGIRSVYFNQRLGKFTVQVGANGAMHYGGLFSDIADAERAAIALRQKLHGPVPTAGDNRQGEPK